MGKFWFYPGVYRSSRKLKTGPFLNRKVSVLRVLLKTGLQMSVKGFLARVPVFKKVEDRSSLDREGKIVACTGLQES